MSGDAPLPEAEPVLCPTDPVAAAELALSMALHSMTHAAGLAMLAGPQAQVNCRQAAAAAIAMTCRGLLDIQFKAPSLSSQG